MDRRRELRKSWAIAIYGGPSPVDLRPIPGIASPVLSAADVRDYPAAFVADPFMVRDCGLWYMFFEVFNRDTLHGAIGMATSDDGQTWTYRQIVLDESFHLSYPYVVRWRDAWYMIPETVNANSVRLYRADPFPSRWRLQETLLEGRLVDASFVEHASLWWMFAGNATNTMLRLFHADRLEGPWNEHTASPIVDNNIQLARPGGRVIEWNGGLLRYAQDCIPEYGTQIWAVPIAKLSQDEYAEQPADKKLVLTPGLEQWNRSGMHHVDPHRIMDHHWIACVDGWYAQWEP